MKVNVPTHLSLFSGIGGLDIAAEMAGFRTVGQCEWADYPTKVLEKHWPDVPRWRDIRTLTGGSFYERTGLRTVDVISGGFPCQPVSVAGKRRGKADDRYLWPEMFRVIQELRPAWVVGENVAGLVTLGLDEVLSDLESIGYACQAFIIPACAVDAAHRRDRCAIVANANDGQCNTPNKKIQTRWDASFNSCCDVSDTKSIGLQGERTGWEQISGTRPQERAPERRDTVCESAIEILSNRPTFQMGKSRSEPESERPVRRSAQPGLGGVVDGVPAWVDGYWLNEPDIPRITTEKKNRANRLKCLGNAVVWRQFYPIFGAIMQQIKGGYTNANV